MKKTKGDLGVVAHQEALGARLKLTISALGMSAAEAARIMNVSPQRLNGWLSGAHPAPIYHLALFCEAKPVTLDWLGLGYRRGLPAETAERLASASADTWAET
jgi:transcriptional regulator with XRE-family HTH domain